MSYNGSGTFLINTAGQPVVSGTVISSTAFNALTADLATGLSTAITKDGQTTITANIPMANYKFTGLGTGSAAGDSANLSQVQSTAVKLLASVSGADTITAVGSPNVAAYAAGQMFYFVAAGANTGAVTINIDSLGAKNITRDGTTALAAGDIQSGEVCVIVYDGTQFQLVNGASQSASIVTENLTVNKATVLNESGGDNDTRIEGDTDANLFFVDASADAVGIGTSSPASKLDVTGAFGTGTTAFTIYNSTGASASNIARIDFRVNNSFNGNERVAAIWGLNPNAGANNGGALVFATSANGTSTTPAERARITSGGVLCVGTTSTQSADCISLRSSTITDSNVGLLAINSGKSGDDADCLLSIVKYSNTNTTSQVFVKFAIDQYNSGSGQINANGASQAAFGSFSDRRLKENIVDLPSQWSNIKALRPVEFDYIASEGGGHQISFVAQEFEEIYPDAVGERPDGMKTLTGWGKTEARLIKALQEAMTRIEALEAEVAALKGAN